MQSKKVKKGFRLQSIWYFDRIDVIIKANLTQCFNTANFKAYNLSICVLPLGKEQGAIRIRKKAEGASVSLLPAFGALGGIVPEMNNFLLFYLGMQKLQSLCVCKAAGCVFTSFAFQIFLVLVVIV